jgi:hypothetical protein
MGVVVVVGALVVLLATFAPFKTDGVLSITVRSRILLKRPKSEKQGPKKQSPHKNNPFLN